jgi:hypothetical protein
MKEVGEIKKTLKITANGVNFLNGEIQSKNTLVPIILIEYIPPDSAEEFAKGERFKMWIKLEDAQYKQIVSQLQKGLREISIWFTKENRDLFAKFLNGGIKPKETRSLVKDPEAWEKMFKELGEKKC